jgi:hypothetical protein
MSEPKYLGDGVYLTDDGYQLKLEVGGHDQQEWEVIYLDQHVAKALMEEIRKFLGGDDKNYNANIGDPRNL